MILFRIAGFGSGMAWMFGVVGALAQEAPANEGSGSATDGPPPVPAAQAGSGQPVYAAEPAADGAAPPSQPPAPPPQAAPGIYVEQPPLPTPMPRTRHLHDGFYLRLSAGFGAMAVESDVGSTGDLSARGYGTAFDVTLGGTPTPGLVIGGGLLFQEAFEPVFKIRIGQSEFQGTATGHEDSVGFALIGPMIDAFPNPNGGFHFGGLVGPAWVGLSDQSGNASSGFGVSVWAGYMWWVSSQWSLGGLLRLSGARTGRSLALLDENANDVEVDAVDTTRSYSILFSAAFH